MENIQSAIDVKGAGIFKQAELFFDDLFLKKLPPLPDNIRDILVKLAPFWAILLIVFAALSIIFGSLSVLFGLLGTVLSIASLSGSSLISSVLGLVQAVVGLAVGAVILLYLARAVKGLFDQKYEGWQFLFRAEVVWLGLSMFSWLISIVAAVVALSGLGTIVGIVSTIFFLPMMLVFAGLAFYLLFQIKHKYARANA